MTEEPALSGAVQRFVADAGDHLKDPTTVGGPHFPHRPPAILPGEGAADSDDRQNTCSRDGFTRR
ncbi:hypothetical protein [Agromyces sp. NPDC058110]|uniref:hypothetical protein n=1 Tax=Agromyces sp. NPDC058110 TaxID=3346345 RepID=UPI0036DBCC10